MTSVLASRLQRQALARQFDDATRRALRESATPVDPRSAPADPRRLRGIPVVGGSPGAIPGTRPDAAVIRRRGG